MSTEKLMNGITHIRTIQCHARFQSRTVHKVNFKYFNVIFWTVWLTLTYSTREILLIWSLNRLKQTINIFVITVTIYNADCCPQIMDKGKSIHGKVFMACKNSAYHGKYIKSCTILLDRLVFPNVCLNPAYQSCFPFSFRFFFPHCGCCLWEAGCSHLTEQPQWFPTQSRPFFPALCPVWMDTLSPHLPSLWKKRV